jgi:hypothetical protein
MDFLVVGRFVDGFSSLKYSQLTLDWAYDEFSDVEKLATKFIIILNLMDC